MVKKRLLIELGLIILTVFLVSLFSATGLIDVLELNSLDWQFQLRPPMTVSNKIMLIGIDDPAIEVLGRWPWSRDYHASLIQALSNKKYKPKVIGFDILFTEADETHPEFDQSLVDQTRESGNIVYASFFEEDREKIILPFSKLTEVSRQGFINAPPDRDGVTRFFPLFIKWQARYYPSLDFQLIADYLDIDYQDVEIIPGRYVNIKKSSQGPFKIPVDQQLRMLINYAGDIERYGGYSAVGILKAASQLEEGKPPCIPLVTYKDKLVLIGLTATGTADLRATPFSPKSPMISVHANVINSILEKNFLVSAPNWLNYLIFILLGLGIGLISIRLSPLRSILTALGILICYSAINFYLFFQQGFYLEMARPVFVILAIYLVIIGYRYIVEESEKRWVKKAFGHYLPTSIMDEILSDPGKLRLGGEKRELTVLFSDIRQFTPYCETRQPEEVVSTLNEYFDKMTDVVFKYNGTVDKFIGDALVVIFGAPSKTLQSDHAERACRAALDMLKELKILQEKWQRQGKEVLEIGIGINTGEMLVGNMGSSKIMDYTVIGDEVNLASRVQGLTRNYDVKAIITESTYLKVKDIVETRPLGEAKVKGKYKAAVIYELIGPKSSG